VDIERTYLYKVSRDGIYLGLIPNVVSEFGYHQEMNMAAVQTDIDVDLSLDTADEVAPILTTEDNRWITTENEIPITAERSIELVGNKDSNRIIANGNDVEIIEISSDHPNGVTVFSGYMSKWRAKASQKDIITITCISNGKDVVDYVYGTNTYTAELSQTAFNAVTHLVPLGAPTGTPSSELVCQSFSGITANLSVIRMAFGINRGTANPDGVPPVTLTLRLYQGVEPFQGGTLLATVTKTLSTIYYPNSVITDFRLPSLVALNGGNYYWTVEASDYVTVLGQYYATDVYAGGNAYWYRTPSWNQFTPPSDLYFVLYSSPAVISDATFTATDPGNMVKQALDGYPGVVSYATGTVDLAGYTLNYPFKLATVLDIIEKARQLAPANYYWYVDVGTQILYFKQTLTTATHKFVIGRHVEDFEVEASIEEIINVVYFSGGPTAGVNMLKLYTDQASLATNKRGLARVTDNRVTDATTASTLGEALMDENDEEIFRSEPLVINANTYDISLIKPGDTVAFEGAGNFIDSIIFQVSALDRGEDRAGLTLGKLPLRSDAYVDQIRRDLDNEQTLANPNTPS
jgi:hypothetical protein